MHCSGAAAIRVLPAEMVAGVTRKQERAAAGSSREVSIMAPCRTVHDHPVAPRVVDHHRRLAATRGGKCGIFGVVAGWGVVLEFKC